MSDVAIREKRTVLCSAPLTMLRDHDGVWLDLCVHHVDESPCPHHEPDAPPQQYLTDLSGHQRPRYTRQSGFTDHTRRGMTDDFLFLFSHDPTARIWPP